MKIAFDQQVFLQQQYGGISGYLCSLVRQLATLSGVQPRIFAPLHVNRNLHGLGPDLAQEHMLSHVPSKLLRPTKWVSQYLARRGMRAFRPDIIHETYYSESDFRVGDAPRVLTAHDLIHERYSHMFENSEGTTRPKKIAAHRADHIICVSENTRRDVIAFCDVPEEKTSVVYLGVDAEFTPATSAVQPLHPRPFLLYVGARGGYKNFDGLLRAFAASAWLRQQFDLVCFGGGALQPQERQAIADLGLRPDQVVQMGGGDDVLVTLYQQAQAFVCPSLYEGFGIPPLEAMAAGCPVVSSNAGSLPEVVGDAAETFDPTDQDAMRAAIERVMESSSLREALIAAGHVRRRMFSWEKCARETEAIYRQLL